VFLTAVMEQRVNIKFCVKVGKTPAETYEMLQNVYGDESSSRSSVFEWFKRFKDGREDHQDDPRSGRPSTSRNADTVENVPEMVTRDRRLALRVMLDELNINKETIRQILHEDLRKRKICAKFVPHSLTDEQKQRRLISCQDFIQTCQDNLSFLDCIVTGDESWVFQYDPNTKRRNMQCSSKPSPSPKKFRLQKSKIKTTLITFFDK
jgi:transposase